MQVREMPGLLEGGVHAGVLFFALCHHSNIYTGCRTDSQAFQRIGFLNLDFTYKLAIGIIEVNGQIRTNHLVGYGYIPLIGNWIRVGGFLQKGRAGIYLGSCSSYVQSGTNITSALHQ